MKSNDIYFKGLKLQNESCQICQTRPPCIVLKLSGATRCLLLRLKLGWKLDISSFPTNIVGLIIHPEKKMMCLKSRLKSAKNVQKLEIQATWRNFSWKLCFYYLILFIYFWIIIFNLGLFWSIRHCLGVYFIIEIMLVNY
jgi:hypothetical protein